MAKHFADTFDISPVTDAVCCKCMAQCVKVRLLYICFIQIRIKLVLISTGFHRGKFIQHINPIILIREKKWKEKFRNRDLADRAERFWAVLHTESFSYPPARPEFFGQSC